MSDTKAMAASGDAPAGKAGPYAGYSHEHRPLGGYFALSSAFGAAFAGSLWAASRKRGLPNSPDAWDVATAGAATFKLTRLITKGKATSFIRAPFVSLEGAAGHGEVTEEPRGEGLRLAVGELLVCPYCLGQWVGSSITVGYVAAPRLTRLLTSLYTSLALADFAQIAYKAAVDAPESE
ncbi:MAG: DUF1360 domain-containing protein [Solirubrobacterales bacterium]